MRAVATSVWRAFGAVALVALATLAAPAWSWETGSDGLAPIPALSARVTDLTGTLPGGDKQSLEAKLAAWEQSTGNQMVVLIVPSTQPEPIESYSIRVAEAWKIGRKGKDNGVLFVIAKNDKKMRLEVGYGLEGVLTDVTAKRIVAETVAPFFRKDEYAAGVLAGVDRVIAVVGKGEPLPPATSAKSASKPLGGFNFETVLILLFVIVPILGRVLSRIFGKIIGSTVGAGIVGAAAWIVAGSVLIAIVAGVISLVLLLMVAGGGGIGRGGGGWIPIGGGGFGGGGGGGGFGGGGGGFGGGGASGDW